MRKGYWRTLIRQMRDKVAAGACSFAHSGELITIIAIEADPDADLDQSTEVLLARDAQDCRLVLDIVGSAVLRVSADGAKRVLATDLVTFVQALSVVGTPSMTLSDAIDEPLDFHVPRRGILGDD